MQYLLPIILIIISYLLGVYFAHQGLRNEMDRPLAYRNETIIFVLTILFGWVPAFLSLYLAYRNSGLLFLVILLVVRFVFMPTIFNNKIKYFMEKNGI